MMSKLRSICFSLFAIALGVMSSVSQAQNAPIVGSLVHFEGWVSVNNVRSTAAVAIFEGDVVITGANSFAEIHFVDQSKLQMGADSEARIQKFASTASGSKSPVLKLVRGFSRLFGGFGSKEEEMQVHTDYVLVGVRGGITDVLVTPNGVQTILQYGVASCTSNDQRQSFEMPGVGCSVSATTDLAVQALPDSTLMQFDALATPKNAAPLTTGQVAMDTANCGSNQSINSSDCNVASGQQPTAGGADIALTQAWGSDMENAAAGTQRLGSLF